MILTVLGTYQTKKKQCLNQFSFDGNESCKFIKRNGTWKYNFNIEKEIKICRIAKRVSLKK